MKPQHSSNPFHFLKRNKNLSQQKPTMCFCTHIQIPQSFKFKDISTFFATSKHTITDDSKTISLQLRKRKRKAYETRQDLIRGAHDRSKRSR